MTISSGWSTPTDEWILQRTGISERHIVDPGVATSDLAKEAALKAIAQAGITPHDIGFIIVGTTTPDMMFPSTACLLQHKIGATHAWGFDLGAACSGFTYALTTAAQLVASGAHDHALVVGADVMSSIIDYTDRTTCVLFGDGAGAVVVSPADGSRPRHHRLRVRGRRQRRAVAVHAGRRQPAAGVARDRRPAAALREAGRAAVFRFAVRKTEEICRRLLERNGLPAATSTCSSRTRPTGGSSCRPPSAWGSTTRRSSSTSARTATPRPRRSRSR